MTRFTLGLAAAVAVAFAGPAAAGDTKQVVKGAVVGGAGGAVVGAIVPGVVGGRRCADRRRRRCRDRRPDRQVTPAIEIASIRRDEVCAARPQGRAGRDDLGTLWRETMAR